MIYLRAIALTLFCAFIFILGMATAHSRPEVIYPYPRIPVITTDSICELDVLVNLEQLIKDNGDDSRLLRYVDKDARVIIYLTQNSTGDMFTSMQAITKIMLDPNSDLYKRMDW